MKKNRLVIRIFVFSCFLLCGFLSACFEQDEEPITLAVPVVTINDEGLATWETVNNAGAYKYIINDGVEVETTILAVQLEDGDSIKVKAVGNNTTHLDSAYSEVVTYNAQEVEEPITLAVPVVTINDEGLATWETVNNAGAYKYIINDGVEVETTILAVQLEDGDSIKVKAVGNNTTHLDSAYSTVETYTPLIPLEVSCENIQCEYDGTEKFISLNGIINGDTVLYSLENDITKAVSENYKFTNVGNYVIYYFVSRGSQQYNGEASIIIEPAIIKDVTIDNIDRIYNGYSVFPEISEGIARIENFYSDKKCETVFSDFTNVFDGTIFAKICKDNYHDLVLPLSYRVAPFTGELVVELWVTEVIYCNSEIKPYMNVSVKDGNNLNETEYEVVYENNINVGTATVTVTGISENIIGANGIATFVITQAPANSSPNYPYDTNLSINYKTGKITDLDTPNCITWVDQDQEYSLGNNIVKGTFYDNDNYESEIITYSLYVDLGTIEDEDLQILESSTFTYDGTGKICEIGGLLDNDVVNYRYNDTLYSDLSFIDVGNYYLKVIVLRNNYNAYTKDVNIQIEAEKWENIEVTLDSEEYEYTGSEIRPAITLKNKLTQTILVENYDYVISYYANNTDCGTGQVYLSNISKCNYEIASDPIEFIIIPSHSPFEPDDFSMIVKYLSDMTLGDVSLPDGYEWNDPTIVLENGKEHDCQCTWTPDNANYLSKEIKVKVTVNENESFDSTMISSVEINKIYDGNSISPEITCNVEGALIQYLVDGEWVDVVPVYCTPITEKLNYRVTKDGYNPYDSFVNVYIGKQDIEKSEYQITYRLESSEDKIDLLGINCQNVDYAHQNYVIEFTLGEGISLFIDDLLTTDRAFNFIDAGRYEINYRLQREYSNDLVGKMLFEINPMELNVEIQYLSEVDLYYTGEEIIPEFNVNMTFDTTNVCLVKGVDYNIYCEDLINAGFKDAYIVGINNYCGSVNFSYEIKVSDEMPNITVPSFEIELSQSMYLLNLELDSSFNNFRWENEWQVIEGGVHTYRAEYIDPNGNYYPYMFDITINAKSKKYADINLVVINGNYALPEGNDLGLYFGKDLVFMLNYNDGYGRIDEINVYIGDEQRYCNYYLTFKEGVEDNDEARTDLSKSVESYRLNSNQIIDMLNGNDSDQIMVKVVLSKVGVIVTSHFDYGYTCTEIVDKNSNYNLPWGCLTYLDPEYQQFYEKESYYVTENVDFYYKDKNTTFNLSMFDENDQPLGILTYENNNVIDECSDLFKSIQLMEIEGKIILGWVRDKNNPQVIYENFDFYKIGYDTNLYLYAIDYFYMTLEDENLNYNPILIESAYNLEEYYLYNNGWKKYANNKLITKLQYQDVNGEYVDYNPDDIAILKSIDENNELHLYPVIEEFTVKTDTENIAGLYEGYSYTALIDDAGNVYLINNYSLSLTKFKVLIDSKDNYLFVSSEANKIISKIQFEYNELYLNEDGAYYETLNLISRDVNQYRFISFANSTREIGIIVNKDEVLSETQLMEVCNTLFNNNCDLKTLKFTDDMENYTDIDIFTKEFNNLFTKILVTDTKFYKTTLKFDYNETEKLVLFDYANSGKVDLFNFYDVDGKLLFAWYCEALDLYIANNEELIQYLASNEVLPEYVFTPIARVRQVDYSDSEIVCLENEQYVILSLSDNGDDIMTCIVKSDGTIQLEEMEDNNLLYYYDEGKKIGFLLVSSGFYTMRTSFTYRDNTIIMVDQNQEQYTFISKNKIDEPYVNKMIEPSEYDSEKINMIMLSSGLAVLYDNDDCTKYEIGIYEVYNEQDMIFKITISDARMIYVKLICYNELLQYEANENPNFEKLN